MAYELIAGIMGVLQVRKQGITGANVRHFIDSNPARQCMIKASSKHEDLNALVGMLWFTAGRVLRNYYCQYVASKLNIADAPSRGHFDEVKRLNARIVDADFSECVAAVEGWMSSFEVRKLVE